MDAITDYVHNTWTIVQKTPWPITAAFVVMLVAGTVSMVESLVLLVASYPLIKLIMPARQSFLCLVLIAPLPRAARPSEKQYITTTPNGTPSKPQEQPCWYDGFLARRELFQRKKMPADEVYAMDEAEVFVSLVVPAYNEEERLSGMLEEAVEYLTEACPLAQKTPAGANGAGKKGAQNGNEGGAQLSAEELGGWEILIVSDGSTDRTIDTALSFARSHESSLKSSAKSKTKGKSDVSQGSIRVISLEQNRGKGGAVTHGMRHARGEYVVFADADGASRFSDLGRLVEGCQRVQDEQGRAVGIGSRAHLVGSEAVVKRSFLRNALMHSFHVLLRLMTPPATAAIRDTQCGFKLFTRPALPYIVPYMHSEGWIFDVEMLMLAESANIPMVEVAIGWKEVKGSKLNVVWDSLGMAWGLAVLRAAWMTGVYRRDV